jgi:hypothetical protein
MRNCNGNCRVWRSARIASTPTHPHTHPHAALKVFPSPYVNRHGRVICSAPEIRRELCSRPSDCCTRGDPGFEPPDVWKCSVYSDLWSHAVAGARWAYAIGRVELSWAELSWAELSWAELSWAELSWAELSWAEERILPELNWLRSLSIQIRSKLNPRLRGEKWPTSPLACCMTYKESACQLWCIFRSMKCSVV